MPGNSRLLVPGCLSAEIPHRVTYMVKFNTYTQLCFIDVQNISHERRNLNTTGKGRILQKVHDVRWVCVYGGGGCWVGWGVGGGGGTWAGVGINSVPPLLHENSA